MCIEQLEQSADWRERRRTSLRGEILASAEALIRRTRGTDFTMRELAERAGVALATPYTLYGSKAGVLYALVTRGIDSIEALFVRAAAPDPVSSLLTVAETSADFYARDQVLYRPLLRFLFGAYEPRYRPMLINRVMQLWDPGIDACIVGGCMLPSVRMVPLRRLLIVNFTGALQLWIQEDLDDDGFRNQVLYGMVLLLLPQVGDTARAPLQKRLVGLERRQPTKPSIGPAPRPRKAAGAPRSEGAPRRARN